MIVITAIVCGVLVLATLVKIAYDMYCCRTDTEDDFISNFITYSDSENQYSLID